MLPNCSINWSDERRLFFVFFQTQNLKENTILEIKPLGCFLHIIQKPVIAMNSGGPLETIEDNKTGILCEEDKKAVADAMYVVAIHLTICNAISKLSV